MSYAGYVTAAYTVFALGIAWDYLASRLSLSRTRRELARRAQREAARRAHAP